MSEHIHLRIGAEPWLPADTAKPEKILNFYDIPLAGIVKQHRHYFFFECLEGHGQNVALWAYAPISRGECRSLKRAEGQELRQLSEEILTSRPFAAALAINYSLEIAALVEVCTSQPQKAAATPKSAAKQAISRKAETVQSVGNLAPC